MKKLNKLYSGASVNTHISWWPTKSKPAIKSEAVQPAAVAMASKRERQNWDRIVREAYGQCHFTQSSAWSEVKKFQGWESDFLFLEFADSSRLPLKVYSRHIPMVGDEHYIPKLAIDLEEDKLASMTEALRNYLDGASVKIEPEQPANRTDLDLEAFGWIQDDNVQYKATVEIDLEPSEAEIFAGLKKRTRYDIRRGYREGVTIKEVEPTFEKRTLLYELMKITSDRSGCFLRSKRYMHKSWEAFLDSGQGRLFAAYHEHDLLAMAFVVQNGEKAWYKDSGSVRQKEILGSSQLLQWEIIKALKLDGCKTYDLAGVPPRNRLGVDLMDGLYTFKSGFNSEITEYLPAYTLPLKRSFLVWHKLQPLFLIAYSKLSGDFWY